MSDVTKQDTPSCLDTSISLENTTDNVWINTEEALVVEVHNCTSDQTELFDLLSSWDLTELFSYLDGQGVYVKDLKLLATINPEYVSNLLKPFKWNVIIKFGHKLKQWQDTNAILDSASNTPSTCTSPMGSISVSSTTSFFNNIPSLSQESSDNINILNILGDSQEGKAILNEIYHKSMEVGELSEVKRDALCNVLVNYFIRHGLKMTTKMCQQLSEEIAVILPTEEKEYYYLLRKNASPLGKLHFKYQNQLARLKKSGLFVAQNQKKRKIDSNRAKDNLEIQLNSEQHCQSLQNDVLNLEELLYHWKGCSTERLRYIAENQSKEIFNRWPQYKELTGYKLISMDYFILFKDAGRLLDDAHINYFSDKILILMKIKIKDPTSKLILENLLSDTSVTLNGRYATIFTLIHAILKTNPMRDIMNDKGKMEKVKCSIKECQNNFIFCCSTTEQLEAHFEKLSRGTVQVQPLIALVGKSYTYPELVIVYMDGIKYKFDSFLQAMDICFKSFHIFNMKYPIAGQIVWEFIQVYFYKEVPAETVHPSIKNLQKELA